MNHERVLNDLEGVYGSFGVSRDKLVKAILSFPPFVGLNHERVLRQKFKIGKLIGLEKPVIVDFILKNPILVGYSFKRDLAAINTAKKALEEFENRGGKVTDEVRMRLLDAYLKYHMTSPYVKLSGSKSSERLRLSEAKKLGLKFEEPPLLKIFRKKL